MTSGTKTRPEAAARRSALAGPGPRPLLVLLRTLEARYRHLCLHGENVARHCVTTARALGMPRAAIERLRLGGLLHDVGKVGVPEAILTKPGPLTAEEWRDVKRHPELGFQLLASAELDDVAWWVLLHHERPDGRGYPYGLTGDQIPIHAKILAVADAYDAMRTDRVYRAALSREEAAQELDAGVGTQFDSDVVRAFAASLAPRRSAHACQPVP